MATGLGLVESWSFRWSALSDGIAKAPRDQCRLSGALEE